MEKKGEKNKIRTEVQDHTHRLVSFISFYYNCKHKHSVILIIMVTTHGSVKCKVFQFQNNNRLTNKTRALDTLYVYAVFSVKCVV